MTDNTIIFQNKFGTIYHNRVEFLAEEGREELPLKHITSVRIETKRSIKWGGILGAVGAICLFYDPTDIIPLVLGLSFILIGIIKLVGSSVIQINTAGQDLRRIKVSSPFNREEAEEFCSTLRNSLYK